MNPAVPEDLMQPVDSARPVPGNPATLTGCGRSTVLFPLLLVALILAAGCDRSKQPSAKSSSNTDELLVLTTSQPLFEMASRIAGQEVKVVSAVPRNLSSRNWKPATDDIRQLQSAGLVLINGAGYEPWKNRISLPESRIVDTAAGYYDQLILVPDFVVHQHGPEGRHSHVGTVWATWLDAELALSQLRQVSTALQKLSAQHSSQFSQRTVLLIQELEALDAEIDALAAEIPEEGFTVLGDGPYYHYLTRRLNWQLEFLHWPDPALQVNGNEAWEPSEADQQELREVAQRSSPRLFLMAAGRSSAAVKFAESIGLRIVSIDLCERMSDTEESFVARLRMNLKRLSAAMKD